MKIERSSLLSCSVEQCLQQARSPRLLEHVASPLVTFEPLNPSVFPEKWQEQAYLVRLRLFGFIPFGQQTINISISAQTLDSIELRDNGHGSLIAKWDHRIIIRSADGGTLYTDRVEIQAGLLTPFVWAFAWLFYRHRQRRWQQLVGTDFSYANTQP